MDYPRVKLDAADTKTLQKLTDAETAIQKTMQIAQLNWENRGKQLASENRAFWEEMKSKYGLDLDHVAYVPSQDGDELIPVQVKLT
tara:strand:+ start:224 stop:481 length:258 start_codon:yes stop_codon:yes gene_type:complete